MPLTLDAVKQSLRLQRLAACTVWLLLVVKLAAVAWLELKLTLWLPWNVIKAVFSPTHWAYALLLTASQIPNVIVHSTLLLPLETEPLQLPADVAWFKRKSYQLLLKWTPTSWLRTRQGAASHTSDSETTRLLIALWQMTGSLNIQFALGRAKSWSQLAKLLLLLASCTLSAVLTMPLFSVLKTRSPGHANDIVFSNILAFTFCWAFLARKQDVLHYSNTNSPYLPRLLAKLPSVLQQAALVTASAVIVKLTVYLLLYLTVGVRGDVSVTAGFTTHLMAGSFCAFCWSTAVCIVQIMYTHRVKHFQEDSEGNPSALLIPALLDTKDPMMQNAAFQDLCFLAEARGPEAWRRRIVFEKDNGEAWQKLGTACMDEVQQMIGTAALLLPQCTGQAQLTETQQTPASTKPTSEAVRWNAPVVTKKALMLSAAQPSELRAWRLHSHRQRITWSLRTLAAFAAAAATEDKRGILHYPPQPDCPDLATVIATLLSSLLVLKEFIQQVATSPLQMDKERQASGPKGSQEGSMQPGLSQHPVYASAYQLQQATQAAIDKVIAIYGQDAAAVLNRIAYPPAYGLKAALQSLAMECVQILQKQQQEQQEQQQEKQQQEQQQKQKQQQQQDKQEQQQ